MLTLYYSPHMTSMDNVAGRASGHADVPLAEVGRKQAQKLGQQYVDKAVEAVFCSDLQRAATTAQIAFGGRSIRIIPDARLREYDYGDLTQAPVAQVEQEFPRRIQQPFPHGESLLMVVERVGAFLREILQQYDGKTVVIIGHRATRYALEYWCGKATLDEIVATPWEWREVPIWPYEVTMEALDRRSKE